MKKFSSIIALSLVAALTFGMTVSAAGSETTNSAGQLISSEIIEMQAEAVNVAAAEVAAEDGNILVATPVTVAVAAKAEDQVIGLLQDQISDLDLSTVEMAVLDLEVIDINTGAEVDPAGIERQIPAVVIPDGKTARIFHADAAGNIDSEVPSVVRGNRLFAKFTNLSPVVMVIYDDVKADDDDDDDDDDDTAAVATTSVAATTGVVASPKTGETVPVAVLFAVASLGAAVVCSRKARYNK